MYTRAFYLLAFLFGFVSCGRNYMCDSPCVPITEVNMTPNIFVKVKDKTTKLPIPNASVEFSISVARWVRDPYCTELDDRCCCFSGSGENIIQRTTDENGLALISLNVTGTNYDEIHVRVKVSKANYTALKKYRQTKAGDLNFEFSLLEKVLQP